MEKFAIGTIIRYKTSNGNIITATVIGIADDEYVKLRTEDGLQLEASGAELLEKALV